AVADALGHRQEVGRNAPVLEPPDRGAGAAEPGLHFVSDAQPAVPPHDVVDDPEVLRRWGHDAAHTLNRLGDEACNRAGSLVADQRLDVARAGRIASGGSQPLRGAGEVAPGRGRGVYPAGRLRPTRADGRVD